MTEPKFALITGLEMVGVGLAAAWLWRRFSGLPQKWLWVGGSLWAVAVVIKLGIGLSVGQKVISSLFSTQSKPLFLLSAGTYLGVQSSLCEIGLTLAAVLKWRRLGENAPRAIAIGLGAGVVEAVLLGLAALSAAAAGFAGLTDETTANAMGFTDQTSCSWLVAPFERAMALLGHTSSRTLVLLGFVHRRPWMVFSGWLMFTLVDGVAGAFMLAGKIPKADPFSMWWLEFAILPFALISIPILRWCWRTWPTNDSPRV